MVLFSFWEQISGFIAAFQPKCLIYLYHNECVFDHVSLWTSLSPLRLWISLSHNFTEVRTVFKAEQSLIVCQHAWCKYSDENGTDVFSLIIVMDLCRYGPLYSFMAAMSFKWRQQEGKTGSWEMLHKCLLKNSWGKRVGFEWGGGSFKNNDGATLPPHGCTKDITGWLWFNCHWWAEFVCKWLRSGLFRVYATSLFLELGL